MLHKWRLKNFRSVRDELELEFAPLTIFAGPNSSGKSTIIQSLLLTAQTVQSPVLTRPVVLNGHMARLGGFTDIVADADESAEVSIGFRLSIPNPEERRLRSISIRHPRLYVRRRASGWPIELECDYAFSMRGPAEERDILHIQPRLEWTSLNVTSPTEKRSVRESFRIRRSARGLDERLKEFQLVPEDLSAPDVSSLEYEVIQSPKAGRYGDEFLAHRKSVGATVRHFLPVRTSVVYEVVETESNRVVAALTEPSRGAYYDLDFHGEAGPLSDEIRQLLVDAFAQAQQRSRPDARAHKWYLEQLRVQDRNISLEEVVRRLRNFPPSLQGEIAQMVAEKKEQLRRLIRADRPAKYDLRFLAPSEHIMTGLDAVQDYFTFSVKYLGPLRDEPKPVYPLTSSNDPGDVGFRGEHTAAVLDTYKNTTVEYVPSSCFEGESLNVSKREGRLLDAVQDWLSYMGVGTTLTTVDRGKLGHEMKVAVAGGLPLHDLTQVGVGVSQVLPILVLSLLADSGATLVFEQPELHLHPRVQTRLADFFVAMTALGKQCVVETHSEYLINRLRYRSVRAAGSEIADSVIIYFVEKREGQSHYRPIRINQYGVIDEWPQGFFDEAENTAAEILRAGVAKRKTKGVRLND